MEPRSPSPAHAVQPTAPGHAPAQAHLLIQAVEDVYRPAPDMATSYRDTSPVPAVGTAPPVPQPGRPPMSQRATDLSALILTTSVASVPISGSVSLVLWTAGHVDPVVVGIVAGAPAVFLAALSRVFKRAKETAVAAPPEIHNHYSGATVLQDHRTVTSQTHALVARTRNELRG
ncbi:hypothetical protein [Streptomyces chrestomyceticus]|uniref:hypothetical protein n=1 Tax=Streptomyces chrestomyceticus TaxID=68185 RepID=UPI0033D701F7